MAQTRLPHAFGRYVLRERVAAGGMAEVFRATLPGFGGFEKAVAVKRMYRQYSHDNTFVEMLTDEAKIVSQLAHPNIVHILDVGRVHDDYYICLEFIEGVDLFRLLQKQYEVGRDMPIAMALYIVAELCSALDYAHARRTPDGQPMHIIHRDVSPQNVLLSHLGEVKLTDFGIAKARYRYTQTQAGVVKGKVYYMSPEQAMGNKELDHRSDLFAAGILLYELLCTRPLYDEEEQGKLLTVVGNARYTWPSDKKSRIPAQLVAVTDRALQRTPGQRYQTGREFRGALLRVAEQLGHRADREQFGAYVRKLFEVPDDRPPQLQAAQLHESTRDYSVLHWASQIAPVPTSDHGESPTPIVGKDNNEASEPLASEPPTPSIPHDDPRRPAKLPRGVVPATEIASTSDVKTAAGTAKKRPTQPASPGVVVKKGAELPPPIPLPAPSSQRKAAPVDEQEEATSMLSLDQINAAIGEQEKEAQEESTAMLDIPAIDAALHESQPERDKSSTLPAKKSARKRSESKRNVPRRASAPPSKAPSKPAKPPTPPSRVAPAALSAAQESTRLQPAMAQPRGAAAEAGSSGFQRPHTAHAAASAALPIAQDPDDMPASWALLGAAASVWAIVAVLAVYAFVITTR